MGLSTTNQSGMGTVAHGSSDFTMMDLFRNREFRKWATILGPIIAVASIATLCVLPFWFSGSGWISNESVKHNLNTYAQPMPGLRFGSKTVRAKQGQTITVEVDIHEINHGGLRVNIIPVRYAVSYKEYTRSMIERAGKSTVKRVAETSGSYRIEFEPRGNTDHIYHKLTGGKVDLLYSAKWDVK